MWDDTRYYCYFMIIFVLVFHVGGAIFTDLEFRDIAPMYGILGAIGLTWIISANNRYHILKKQKEDFDKIDDVDLNAH